MIEVEQTRDVEVRWHVMSLALLNAEREGLTEEYKERMAKATGPVRVCIAAEQAHGAEALGRLYTAMGERRHVKGEDFDREMVKGALVDAGLPDELVDAIDDTSYDEALRASHEAGMAPVGLDVGTPVIHVDGVAFFGPVVTPAPRGEMAAQLWDGVLLVAKVPGFYEIKRTRDAAPTFD
jgi:hypothetical protein